MSDWILERLAALERRVTGLEQQLAIQPEPPPAKGRARALPEAWQPREQDIAWAREAHPNVNEAAERDKFADYWRARGDARKDWNAAYRNWIRKAAELSPAVVTSLPGRPATRGAAVAEANRQLGDRLAAKLAALWGDTPRR